MSHTDISKSQATNRTSCHASHKYQQITGNELDILPSDFSKSQATKFLSMSQTHSSQKKATNRPSCHASYKCQQISGNKPFFLPYLITMPHTDTNTSHATKSYISPCVTQTPANKRQQIVHLTMPYADTNKSQATNRTSCHVSDKYQQISGNTSYISPCLRQIPTNHRQQIVHLAMPQTDTSKSQATNQVVANQRQQIVPLAISRTDINKSQVLKHFGHDAVLALG